MKRRALVLALAPILVLATSTVEAAAQAAPTAAAASQVGADYLIGPGDVLQVFVWRNPELTVSVPVRPDGKISTPLVEDMSVVGKTPSTLARDIEKVLSAYIRSPEVNIIVTSPVSALSQVKVIGEVGNPQSIGYRQGMTVLDVLLAAGGLGEFAAGNRGYILRTENGQQKRIAVRLKDLLNKGALKQNFPMQAGDVLVVPQSRF